LQGDLSHIACPLLFLDKAKLTEKTYN